MTSTTRSIQANSVSSQIKTFWNDEEGATAVEYGLIAALIGAFIAAAVSTLGHSISSLFGTLSNAVTSHSA